MTTSDDARSAMVENLISGPPDKRDRFIITTLLDIKENGCAKACGGGGDNATSQEINAVSNIFGNLEYKGLKVSGMAAVVFALVLAFVAHTYYVNTQLEALQKSKIATEQHFGKVTVNP